MAARKSTSSGSKREQGSSPAAADSQTSTDDDSKPAGRSIWSGSISFGLLQIPVSMHTAESRSELHFNQLDKHDLSPIGYKRVNKTTGQEVNWGDIVRGYEYEKGQYVVLTDEDFKAANVQATETIDIQDFVPAGSIPPTYFETPYYLAPTKRSFKAYAVLREALEKTKRIAVATFVMRSREHLAAVVVQGDVLVLHVLRYAYELKSPESLPLPKKNDQALRIHPKEIEMAQRLIEEMTDEWDPSKYKDTYREDLLAKIEEKVRTGKITPAHMPPKEQEGGTVIDIMELLKRSLDKRGGAGEKRAAKGSHAREERDEDEGEEEETSSSKKEHAGPRGVRKTQPRKAAKTSSGSR